MWVASLLAATAALAQPTGIAVEYYHAGFDHYFITARPSEIDLLDGGAFGGVWRRTGQSFAVWTAAGAGTQETCRLFTEAYPPKSSHFYTPYASECTSLRQGTTWQFEDIAFHLKVNALGNCPSGSSPLFRLYNRARSGAPNHRYTTSRSIFDDMVSLGWDAEGAGADIVFACVPSPGGTASAAGYYEGTISTTSTGEEFFGYMFDDGTFTFIYTGTNGKMGVVDGSATFESQTFTAPGSGDFLVLPTQRDHVVTVSGTFVPRQSLAGTIVGPDGTRTFVLHYIGTTGTPPPLASLVGTFAGLAVTETGTATLQLTIASDGTLSGNGGGCIVTGFVRMRSNFEGADATVNYGGTSCALGNANVTGLALGDVAFDALSIIARSAGRDRVFVYLPLPF